MQYPGGKGVVFRHLINLMPPHSMYVEAFLGGGAVWRHKKAALVNVGIDLDGRVIAEHGGTAAPPQTAVGAPTVTNGGASWQLVAGDCLDWLASAELGVDALVYADPPYVMSTRRGKRPLYKHEFSYADHVRLIAVLRSLGCMVMLSGYWSQLYEDELGDWNTVQFDAYDRAGNKRVEWVWCNYELPPERLHDYGWLGADYRERERISRKRRRWVNRLRNLPPLERYALLAAIEDAGF